MALKKIDASTPMSSDGVRFDVNNGDLQALLQIKDKWGFKGEAEVLRYALAVLKQAEKQVVYIDKNGAQIGLSPSEDLVIKREE